MRFRPFLCFSQTDQEEVTFGVTHPCRRARRGEKQPAEQLDARWETRGHPQTRQRHERLCLPLSGIRTLPVQRPRRVKRCGLQAGDPHTLRPSALRRASTRTSVGPCIAPSRPSHARDSKTRCGVCEGQMDRTGAGRGHPPPRGRLQRPFLHRPVPAREVCPHRQLTQCSAPRAVFAASLCAATDDLALHALSVPPTGPLFLSRRHHPGRGPCFPLLSSAGTAPCPVSILHTVHTLSMWSSMVSTGVNALLSMAFEVLPALPPCMPGRPVSPTQPTLHPDRVTSWPLHPRAHGQPSRLGSCWLLCADAVSHSHLWKSSLPLTYCTYLSLRKIHVKV